MLLGKHINKFYLKYWYLFVLGIIALVTVDYVQTYEPVFLGNIVDALSVKDAPVNVSLIIRYSYLLLAVAVVMAVGRMVWRFTLFSASTRIQAGIRRDMFLKAERLSQNYYHTTKVGSIMSWFTTDLDTIEEYMGFGTVQIVDAAFLGILVLIRMFRLDWVLTLFSLIPMVLIIVWGALVEKFMAMKWEERQKEYDRLYDFTQENFTGIRVIKAFVKETSEIHAFAKIAKKNKETNISFVKVSVFFDTVIESIIAVILSLILGFGSWFVYAFVTGSPVTVFGHSIVITAGELITFIGFFNLLVWPMIALGSLVTMLSRAKTSLKRVSAFLDADEDVKSPENAVKLENVSGAIEFRHCSFSYPGAENRKALDDITLKIEPGETVGVVGRIGRGKTTLVTLLTRLYNVEPGTVFIDGHDIMDCDITSVRDSVAVVPQDNFLFSDTVGNNIAFSADGVSDDKIREAAAFADVAENIEAFPEGYETVTGERGVTLSGGQKQRISIARAYLKNAPILIMDDSVSAVDVKTEEAILKNIREKRAGKTTIVIASRVSTVSHFSKIIVLADGKLEAFDTHENLMKISPTYQKMVYLQELEKEVEGGRR
ncbi:MAG: ABC transporter ATP-binding protein/permease [Clostridia bacterium]|nr:ABC transporter ATP-binding protein/permease [Clostridia bacterium]